MICKLERFSLHFIDTTSLYGLAGHRHKQCGPDRCVHGRVLSASPPPKVGRAGRAAARRASLDLCPARLCCLRQRVPPADVLLLQCAVGPHAPRQLQLARATGHAARAAAGRRAIRPASSPRSARRQRRAALAPERHLGGAVRRLGAGRDAPPTRRRCGIQRGSRHRHLV